MYYDVICENPQLLVDIANCIIQVDTVLDMMQSQPSKTSPWPLEMMTAIGIDCTSASYLGSGLGRKQVFVHVQHADIQQDAFWKEEHMNYNLRTCFNLW